MSKILKIILTIIFVAGFTFEIYEMTLCYSDVVLIAVVFAVGFFMFHLFAWIAPKSLANLCFRINRHNPFASNYDETLDNVRKRSVWFVILANIFLIIGILLTVL